jgi:hypothetical protein
MLPEIKGQEISMPELYSTGYVKYIERSASDCLGVLAAVLRGSLESSSPKQVGE